MAGVLPPPGARHGDIEQAAVLILVRSQDTLACVCDGGRIARLVPGPDNRLRPIQRYRDELRRMMPGRPGGRVGENDGGSLKPFGAVHRHDADFVASLLHVALHFRVGRAQP